MESRWKSQYILGEYRWNGLLWRLRWKLERCGKGMFQPHLPVFTWVRANLKMKTTHGNLMMIWLPVHTLGERRSCFIGCCLSQLSSLWLHQRNYLFGWSVRWRYVKKWGFVDRDVFMSDDDTIQVLWMKGPLFLFARTPHLISWPLQSCRTIYPNDGGIQVSSATYEAST